MRTPEKKENLFRLEIYNQGGTIEQMARKAGITRAAMDSWIDRTFRRHSGHYLHRLPQESKDLIVAFVYDLTRHAALNDHDKPDVFRYMRTWRKIKEEAS